MQASPTHSTNVTSVVKGPTCDDCYFRHHSLCALDLERPCPTFRATGRTLQPPRQPRLVPRPAIAGAVA